MFAFLKKPFFVLAPMDDVTDAVFRQVINKCASPNLYFSEFVNVDGLASRGRPRLLPKLDCLSTDPPLIAHIWGLKPDNFYQVAKQIASGDLANELGLSENFAGIDLNMGCPARVVVKTGACSALIKNPDFALEIIQATKSGAGSKFPISVKTRLGYDQIKPEWIKFLLNQHLAMLSVHLRTTKEMSLVPAHYQELKWIKAMRDDLSPKTLLVANGDILNRSAGLKLIADYGIDGAMIGRGIFQDPYAFSVNSQWAMASQQEKIGLFKYHLELFAQWADNPDRGVKRMNKYAKIYINGFNGAKELRESIAQANTINEMLSILTTKE